MQYRVVESIKSDSVQLVYDRFHSKGRMLPVGLIYIAVQLETGCNHRRLKCQVTAYDYYLSRRGEKMCGRTSRYAVFEKNSRFIIDADPLV